MLQSRDSLTIRVIAKDYGLSAQRLNEILHELGIQYKQSGTWLLYQQYAGRAYTNSNTHIINEEGRIRVHTYWTQKGRLFIYETIKSPRRPARHRTRSPGGLSIMASNRELKYNAAGYKDRTAYKTLMAAEQPAFTPTALVYICSRYRGDTACNIRIPRQFCAVAVEHDYAPLAPHLLLTQFMDDEDPAQRATAFGINRLFLHLCEELWVYHPRISTGITHEIQTATVHQIPIRYFNYDFHEARR